MISAAQSATLLLHSTIRILDLVCFCCFSALAAISVSRPLPAPSSSSWLPLRRPFIAYSMALRYASFRVLSQSICQCQRSKAPPPGKKSFRGRIPCGLIGSREDGVLGETILKLYKAEFDPTSTVTFAPGSTSQWSSNTEKNCRHLGDVASSPGHDLRGAISMHSSVPCPIPTDSQYRIAFARPPAMQWKCFFVWCNACWKPRLSPSGWEYKDARLRRLKVMRSIRVPSMSDSGRQQTSCAESTLSTRMGQRRRSKRDRS
mmetsp:Transcript_7724/g.28482  ORF Transcript_7724/g.28482 Transcript_7724/m.28482 type:complete len:260 (+) Transcript_7724:446-1225(+)